MQSADLWEVESGRSELVEAVIREAAIGDYEALCELFEEVNALHTGNLPGIFQEPTGPFWEPEHYRGLLADESVGLFVAEVNQRTVGVAHAFIRDTPAIPILVPRRYAIVDCLGVRSEYRGRGIGHRLMHRIHEWAIAKGAVAIELNVYEFNRDAIGFYRELGYETVSYKMSKLLERAGATG